jgi:succinate dehydrogenase / fumarate reductase, membrane anchor subunit
MANDNNNIGPKRQVVGAHYGMVDWLAQRVTAIVMALYTIVLLVTFLTTKSFGYEAWAGMFAQQWFKLISLVTFIALLYHAWVGMRNIWMDYIKPVGVRLALQVFTVLWLVACAAWAVQILWRV